MSTRQMIYLD